MEDHLFVQIGHMWVAIAKIECVKPVNLEGGQGFRIYIMGNDEPIIVQPYLAPQFEQWLERHSLK